MSISALRDQSVHPPERQIPMRDIGRGEVRFLRIADLDPPQLLRDRRITGSVKLHCGGERPFPWQI